MDFANKEVEEAWDYLIEHGIATESELQLVTDIEGYSMSSLDDVVNARTEWHSVQQLKEEDENAEKEDE